MSDEDDPALPMPEEILAIHDHLEERSLAVRHITSKQSHATLPTTPSVVPHDEAF